MNTTLSNSSFSVSNYNCSEYSPVFLSARSAAYTINAILGLSVNSYIMWQIVSGAAGTAASEILTFNLALSELLSSLGCVFTPLFAITNILWMIHLCMFFDFFIYISRPIFQTFICVERYLAVLQPVFFLRFKPLRYRVAICSGVWLLVFPFAINYVLNIATAFAYYSILVFYILIILVMLFCSMSVLRALRQSGPGDRKKQAERDERNNVKRKAFDLTLIYMSVPLSYSVSTILIPFYSTLPYIECYIFLFVTSVANILTGLINPVLFLKRLKKLPCIKDE